MAVITKVIQHGQTTVIKSSLHENVFWLQTVVAETAGEQVMPNFVFYTREDC